jgi:hypothetical protein
MMVEMTSVVSKYGKKFSVHNNVVDEMGQSTKQDDYVLQHC